MFEHFMESPFFNPSPTTTISLPSAAVAAIQFPFPSSFVQVSVVLCPVGIGSVWATANVETRHSAAMALPTVLLIFRSMGMLLIRSLVLTATLHELLPEWSKFYANKHLWKVDSTSNNNSIIMLTHKHKVRMARKMRTPQETRKHIPLFQTEAWERRKKATALRVNSQGKRRVS